MNAFPARLRPIPLPRQYSAETVRSDGDKGRIFTDGQKLRTEQTVNDVTTISLWRPDVGKGYRIALATNTYTTHAITPEMEAALAVHVEDDVEWEHVGTEPFGARSVDVYDVYEIGTARRRSRIHVDCETGIRWKEVTFNKLGKEVLTIETKNVAIGPPPPSVFELPPGLKEIRMK